jgi:NAD(P)H dehydrogenase (quinone)
MAVVHIIYHSVAGHTERLAESIAEGVQMVSGCSARIFPVEQARQEHVTSCQGLLLGCPTYMGNVTAAMKKFIDDVIGSVWEKGGIPGVVGSAFTSSGSLHGDKEFTLLALQISMFQMGMTLVSLPPKIIQENKNLGYSHGVATSVLGRQPNMIPQEDLIVASHLGKQVAEVARQING